MKKRWIVFFLPFVLVCVSCTLTSQTSSNTSYESSAPQQGSSSSLDSSLTTIPPGSSQESSNLTSYYIPEGFVTENGRYDQKEQVAAYLVTFKELPINYVKKSDNKATGESNGGDRFYNKEKLLPALSGNDYYVECDIDAAYPKSRGAKRIVFSAISLSVYYTSDHYSSFAKYEGYQIWNSNYPM